MQDLTVFSLVAGWLDGYSFAGISFKIHAHTLPFLAYELTNFSIRFRDGSSISSSTLVSVSGSTTLNKYYYSTGSYMYVQFKTDGSVVRSGFRAYWTRV